MKVLFALTLMNLAILEKIAKELENKVIQSIESGLNAN